MPKQCWYILTKILCLGEGGGIRQQTSSTAPGGHANSMRLCCMVEQLSRSTLGGGCKLEHHRDIVNVSVKVRKLESKQMYL